MKGTARHLTPPTLAAAAALAAWAAWTDAGAMVPLPPTLAAAFPVVLGTLSCFAVAWLAARVVDVAVGRTGPADKPQVPRFLSDLARAVLFIVAGFVTIAQVFQQPVTGLLATSGVLIAVLGFALRNILADLFSGIALSLEHPYRLGDWVETEDGLVGRVDEITWRSTRLLTLERKSVVVPNGLLAGRRLVNYSAPEPWFRASLRVTLDHGLEVGRAKRLLLGAALSADGILRSPAPDVLVEGADDTGVHYAVRYWVPDYGQAAPCRDAVGASVVRHLRRAGVNFARPKRELARPARAPDPAAADGCRQLLGELAFFKAFSPEERERLAQAARPRRVAAGAVVVAQGDPGRSLFLVGEGVLDACLADADGRAVELGRMCVGDLFGEMSLLTGQPRSASVVAVTDALLFELDRADLDPLLQERPALAKALAALMTERQVHNEALLHRSPGPGAGGRPADTGRLLARMRKLFRLPD